MTLAQVLRVIRFGTRTANLVYIFVIVFLSSVPTASEQCSSKSILDQLRFLTYTARLLPRQARPCSH